MYGWINGCLEDLILEVYGNGIWEQIKSKAKCHLPTGDFFRSVHYDDESTYALVSAACSVLGAPVDVLLEAFGRHFIYYLEQNGYDSTMKSQGNSLREWIKNVNEPHRLLRSRFPKSSLPEFWTENDESDETGETVLLHYYSTRGGRFVSVVVGIIKEAAKRYFDQEIEMHMVSAEDVSRVNVNFHAVWRIPQVGKDSSGSVCSNVTPPVEAAELRCPFHNRASSSSGSKSSSPVVPSTSSALEAALPDIGISGKDFRRIFPSHIIVDQSMIIRQAGNTLLNMMLSRGINILNRHIGDLFALTLPDDFPFNWQSLRKLRDANIEMVTKTVTSSSEKGTDTSIKFRGEVMFLNENASQPEQTMAVFLINPYVSAMQDLMQLDLSLNDLPKHSFQRDVLLIGEHVRSETDYGIKLTQLSKRLDQESKRAKDALKMKRIFVRYVSHEIRTPLNVSILGLKCLEDELRGESTATTDPGLPPTSSSLSSSAVVPFQKGHLSEGISDVLDDVKISCALAVEILNDLLLYEKIDDGIFSIATTHMSVKALVEEAEKLFRMQARAANVDFVLDLQDQLLDMAYVDVDKGKLHQVLRNLVTNAIKFTSANGEVRLTCRVLQEEENAPTEPTTGIATAEGCIAQPHFLPLLQRHERGRVSRSDSLSSIGSSEFSQAYSQSSRGNIIHFATLEHDALPYGSANVTGSLAGAASITVQSVGTASSSSRSGPQALSSSPYVMNQWPSVLHRQYEVSEIIDPVSAKYSSHQRRKRPRWDDDTKAVSSTGPSTTTTPHRASTAMISETEDDGAAAVDEGEEVPSPVVRKFVRIAVQDTGPGISAEDQSQLFHEFIQVKADKLQNGQGSGLGLWIAANIMKMHGGRIGVMSEGEGKGSTFLIDIPLVDNEEDTNDGVEAHERLEESAVVDDIVLPTKRPRLSVSHDPQDDHMPSSLSFASPELLDVNQLMVPHSSRTMSVYDSSAVNKETISCTQPRRSLKDINVLIVDDVPSNRKVVRRLLRDKFGFIDEAENGQVAVNKVHDAIEQGKPFDLILMDFMMPVMNGLDATRLIQARCHGQTPHDVLVIGVTGNGLEADIAAFKEAGADEVMLKPLDYPTFLEYLYKYGYDVTLDAKP